VCPAWKTSDGFGGGEGSSGIIGGSPAQAERARIRAASRAGDAAEAAGRGFWGGFPVIYVIYRKSLSTVPKIPLFFGDFGIPGISEFLQDMDLPELSPLNRTACKSATSDIAIYPYLVIPYWKNRWKIGDSRRIIDNLANISNNTYKEKQ
jgi:hypothetical protein